MTKVLNIAKRFVADEEGASLIEYTVLIGVMLVTVIFIINKVGVWINAEWAALNSNLPAAP
jgi:pilus assembly protein Flp/PilA